MKTTLAVILSAALAFGLSGCAENIEHETKDPTVTDSTPSASAQAESTMIMPITDPLKEPIESDIPDGVYHVTADGSKDYFSDSGGQYLNLEFWSYETFDKAAVNQMKVGDTLYLEGQPCEIHTLERHENSLGETTYVDMNGGFSEGGISLAFDYDEDCFRELMENDAYALYSVGTRKMKLADDFLYVDHSSAANPGDEEPEWARGDASAFPDFIAGRELYGNNSYAEIRNGELAALNIEWTP
nr:hypothetical protein [uncultured Oscillibacter sp.]